MTEENRLGKNWPALLLAWFDRNKRDLPWREAKPRNPYHVWISEIMLQQTRTEAVKPYFVSWMERFPTIHDLAHADEADVLHQWQGLGYYTRARNIHRAAREVEETYGGRLPENKEEILTPGLIVSIFILKLYRWLRESEVVACGEFVVRVVSRRPEYQS